MIAVGGIEKDNQLFIYGYSPNPGNLVFIKISNSGCGASPIDNINEKLSCKIIGNEFFVCATIISSNLEVGNYIFLRFTYKIYQIITISINNEIIILCYTTNDCHICYITIIIKF